MWASVIISPIRDEGGRLIGYSKVTRENSASAAAPRIACARASALRQLVDKQSTTTRSSCSTPQGYVATWNARRRSASKGYRADEIIGQHFSVFYRSRTCGAGQGDMSSPSATTTGPSGGGLAPAPRKRHALLRQRDHQAFRNEQDSCSASPGTRDLTERRRTQEAQEARAWSRARQRGQDEFLAMPRPRAAQPLAPIVDRAAAHRPARRRPGRARVGVTSAR